MSEHTDKEKEITKQFDGLLDNICQLYDVNRKRLYRILSEYFDKKAKEIEDFDYSMKTSLAKLRSIE